MAGVAASGAGAPLADGRDPRAAARAGIARRGRARLAPGVRGGWAACRGALRPRRPSGHRTARARRRDRAALRAHAPRNAADRLPPLRALRARRPGAGRDAPHRRPGTVLRPRRAEGRGAGLGSGGAALRSPVAGRLGRRRLLECRPAGGARRPRGRRDRRGESDPRPAVPQSAASQPVQPLEQVLLQPPAPGRHGGRGLRGMCRGPASCRRSRAECAARRAAGERVRPLRPRGAGQAAGVGDALPPLPPQSPRTGRPPGRSVPAVPAGPRGDAPRLRHVRSAAGTPACPGRVDPGLDRLAGAVPAARSAGGGGIHREAPPPGGVLRVPAVAVRSAAGLGRAALHRAGDARRPVPGPCRRSRPGGIRGVVEPGPDGAGRPRRRAARRLQFDRPGLGPGSAVAGRTANDRLRAVHRVPAGQHAPRRRAAHRSRHGADAPVLGAGRAGADRRHLRAVSVPGPVGSARPWRAGATAAW